MVTAKNRGWNYLQQRRALLLEPPPSTAAMHTSSPCLLSWTRAHDGDGRRCGGGERGGLGSGSGGGVDGVVDGAGVLSRLRGVGRVEPVENALCEVEKSVSE